MSDNAQPAPTNVGRSSLIMASGTMVSRILGFAKAALLTATLGHSTNAVDAFTQANQLPAYLYQLTVGGVLTAVLVPQITKAIRTSDRGQAYVNKIATLALILFTIMTAVLTILSPWIIRLYTVGWSEDRLALTVAFAYWCIPQLFFYGLYSLIGGILNAHRVFGPYMWAPALNNVIGIAGLVAFLWIFGADPTGTVPITDWDASKISLLAGSATLGVIVQASFLLLYWKKTGLRYRPDIQFRGVGLGSTVRAAGWIIGAVILSSLQTLIQTRVLSSASGSRAQDDLSIAGVTTYEYAALIYMLPHSIAAVSIATVYFTQMSEHAAANRLTAFVKDFSSGARHIGMITVFASFVIAVLSFPIARFFSPDNFDSIRAFAFVLMALTPALPFMSVVFVATRGLYALDDTKTPFLVVLGKFVLILPGYLLVVNLPAQWIAVGVSGLVIVMMVFESALLVLNLRKKLGHIDGHRLLRTHIRLTLGSILAAFGGLIVAYLLGAYDAAGWMLSTKITAVLGCLIVGVVMLALYAGALKALRVSELSGFTSIVSRKFSRR